LVSIARHVARLDSSTGVRLCCFRTGAHGSGGSRCIVTLTAQTATRCAAWSAPGPRGKHDGYAHLGQVDECACPQEGRCPEHGGTARRCRYRHVRAGCASSWCSRPADNRGRCCR
jgi:hypothetical protein